MHVDTREIVPKLKSLESIAVISRVSSTNLVARRVLNECLDNDLSLPSAMIVAGEQYAGQGRNDRVWSSPPGKGIYSTTLTCRSVFELPLVPLAMAVTVAGFLRETFAIDARVKWPNDVLVDGRKIAGILIESRIQGDRAYLLVGTGINIEPMQDPVPNSVSVAEVAARPFGGIDHAVTAFIEHVDQHLSQPLLRDEVLSRWRALAVHRRGDRLECVLDQRRIAGRWAGIDDDGRALIDTEEGRTAVSAGDLLIR